MPIEIPSGVELKINGNKVTVTGPKGELCRTFSIDMSLKLSDNKLTITRPSDSRQHRSLHGLTRALLANMVHGVSQGFEKDLDIVGVGYRAEKDGEKLVFRIGYSHPVEVTPMPGITLTTEKPTSIKVSGIDKEVVGQAAAEIRAIRPPDSYKGKGIRYVGEVVRLKPGKAGKATAEGE
jgi:large subunit ribosomal protein L6